MLNVYASDAECERREQTFASSPTAVAMFVCVLYEKYDDDDDDDYQQVRLWVSLMWCGGGDGCGGECFRVLMIICVCVLYKHKKYLDLHV